MVAQGYEPVRNQLDAYLLSDPAFSAQLSVYHRGEHVVDLVGGPDLDEDSITGVHSVSKGVAGVTFATLVKAGVIDVDAPVAEYWPEFGAAGKDRILVRELLSHQAGLVNAPGGLTRDEIIDSARGAERLAATSPLWAPGSASGYHAVTIGILLEELVRRVTGDTLQNLYETRIRAPRSIDFWLGLPEDEEHRFRTVLPMVPTPQQHAEMQARQFGPDSITAHAFNLVREGGEGSIEDVSPNHRDLRAAGFASGGGIGSADGLARVYAAALESGGDALLDEATIETMSRQQTWGEDRVLGVTMSFGVVFMRPQPRMEFGSYRAFGHDGAGGALGFADPLYDLAFGYIPLPMQYPGGADPKAVVLSQLVRQCVRQADLS
ncbi:hypothetical protein ASF46_14400 [Rathayibacter sp. Leaf296]|nr:hypothetical protein ASF46_14400 [Rathayibacter sp. Leaf296]